MSRSPLMGAVAYEAETNFNEVAATWGTRLSVLGAVDFKGFMQERVASERQTQYRNQVLPDLAGAKSCEFTIQLYLAGHGSTCAGTITISDLEALLGIAIGRGSADVQAASSSGGTTATSGGSTTSLNTTAANGFRPGAIARAGTLGDGRGNGQPFVVSSHASNAMALLTALASNVALNANDVIYSPVNINVPESPVENTITSTRWLLQTANGQYKASGCYPKKIEATFENGKFPRISITFGGAWWDYADETFPSTDTMQTPTPAIVAGGSFNLGTVGSTARNLLSISSFSLTYTMNVSEQTGPGSPHAESPVIGCVRLRDDIMVEFTLDAGAQSTNPTMSALFDGGPYWLLYGTNAVDGSNVSLFMPYLVPTGPRPTQETVEGRNANRLRLRVGTGPTTTDELRASALRIALG